MVIQMRALLIIMMQDLRGVDQVDQRSWIHISQMVRQTLLFQSIC